jgi:imidazoleglycerol-phosphate dehydratase / histidinol-phosphatase
MKTKKKVLFIDRDGTILLEPPTDFQVDSFEKFSFYPGVIRNLYKIQAELDYEFVLVTNQDGLGTSSYPEETFWIIKSFFQWVPPICPGHPPRATFE